MGYRTIIARYVAKWGIAQMCLCETKYQGGVSHHFGGVPTSLKKYRAIRDIAAIVSQYRAIWGRRPGWQYDVAATRGADSVLASDCRAQCGRPSTRGGCRICVTVRLPVRPRGETMYWQANANTPLSVTPLLNVPY